MPKEGGKQVTLVLARSFFSVVRPLAVRCHAKRFVLIRLLQRSVHSDSISKNAHYRKKV